MIFFRVLRALFQILCLVFCFIDTVFIFFFLFSQCFFKSSSFLKGTVPPITAHSRILLLTTWYFCPSINSLIASDFVLMKKKKKPHFEENTHIEVWKLQCISYLKKKKKRDRERKCQPYLESQRCMTSYFLRKLHFMSSFP